MRWAIRHLHISHNAPYLPPKILHNLCFSFLLGITTVPREIENNTYAKFWGAKKVHFGRCASGILAGGNPRTWPLVTALCDYALPEHWLVILNARTIWENLNLAEENWFEQDAKISPLTLSSSKMRLIASIDSFPERNVKERLINE